jgi:hypothetical protein
MPIQKCPMCLKTKKVVKSHLFPRASYKYFRERGFDPVFVSEDLMHPTTRQIWAHLLCVECEDILNAGGESWLMPLLAQHSASFPLYDLIAKSPCVDDDGNSKVYAAAGVPGLDTDKLLHVALGIFWKSSVHHWLGKPPKAFINLGAYGESIRKFLRGEGPFKHDMALCMTACVPPVKELCFTLPRYLLRDGFEQFFFYFAGMKFDLLFGAGLRDIKQLCLHSSDGKLIMVTDLNPEMRMVMTAGTKSARRTKKLISDIAKRKRIS